MIIIITNRKLCKEDFLVRIEKLAKAKVKRIILREKDLKEYEYKILAGQCKDIMDKYKIEFYIHSYYELGKELGIDKIQLPFLKFQVAMKEQKMSDYRQIGVSIHSIEEAKEAQYLGATHLIAGHIFQTDCKKGLEPRGLEFLKEVCQSVSIPVWAIGGITAQNYPLIRKSGAVGACIMSSAMNCENIQEFFKTFEYTIK